VIKISLDRALSASRTLLTGLLLLLIASCGTAIPIPQEADIQMLPVDLRELRLADLLEGRRQYVQNCGGCHRLRSPREKTPAEWVLAFAEMKRRVRLTPREEDQVLAFLRVFAARPLQPDSAAR
jgi:uncharacterized ParB-like nuclease family protein